MPIRFPVSKFCRQRFHYLIWLSDNNVLVTINEVELRWARLVPRWTTVLQLVNHLSAEPAIQVYSAWPSLRGQMQ